MIDNVFDGNNTHKSATILHNFGSGSILISTKCNVIQKRKKIF